MKQEHINEIKAIVILALGIIVLASLVSYTPADLSWYTSHPNIPAHNWIRTTGAYLSGVLFFIFGYSAYSLVVFLFFLSWSQFSARKIHFSFAKFLCALVLLTVISSLLSMTAPLDASIRFGRAGIVGLVFSDFLTQNIGHLGSYVILLMLGTLSLIIIGEFLVSPLVLRIAEEIKIKIIGWQAKREKKASVKEPAPLVKAKVNWADIQRESRLLKDLKGLEEDKLKEEFEAKDKAKEKLTPSASSVRTEGKLKEDKPTAPQINIVQPLQTEKEEIEEDKPLVVGDYTLPTLDLLDEPPVESPNKIQTGLISGAKLLEETLSNFGVAARVAHIERGPVITIYELEPAPGVKVQKFTALSDDIALAMRTATVRIVAPIPGKNRVGIEVPNGASASVYLKEILSTNEFRSSSSKLTLCLGKEISGKAMIADLADMPHLLIAGTTGSGKTVCVNGIITSMLFNASPAEVRFVMVDPKMVELAQYNDIPHLLCPTVTDTKKAAAVLNWVVSEMENRYKKLSREGVRNIKAYNADGLRMPYIVVIIDELADLMQISAKTVESSIARLAQLSRAVGIHLILATQRPSVDVITGVIKANFPARISFKVASKVDSRTVLDMNGAENLLGKGDMLFIKPGDAKPTRGQCSYLKDEEIGRVIKFIKDQQKPSYDDTILTHHKSGGPEGPDDKDEYYDEAVRLVMETNQASVSILQRRMRLGYTRAARLIDMMEQKGLVGPYCGSKPRDILVDREQWLLENMGNESGEKVSERSES